MCTTRLFTIILLSFLLLSCEDDHPDISGRTKVSYTIAGVNYLGDKESDFSSINDIEDIRELFIFSIDTTSTNRLDMKFTIPRRGTGTYQFSGSLEDTEAYLFLTQRNPNGERVEYFAPHSASISGTVTTVINNGNHIRGNFNVTVRDIENIEPDLQISEGYFDIRY